MIAALLLIAYALAAAGAAPLLRKGIWAERSPRVGIIVWQSLSATVIASVVLAGAMLAVPAMPFTMTLAEFLRACVTVLREQYSTPGGAAVTTAGALMAAAVSSRAAYFLVSEFASARKTHRRQVQSLALLGRRDPSGRFFVVDHQTAAAYCLPGRNNGIVLTSAAMTALDEGQRAAVIAHEMAHLRARHHLIVAAAKAIERAFPRIPVFTIAHDELRRLIEMDADDRAARSNARLTVAAAMVRLAEAGPAPTAALNAGGPSVLARVRRLAKPSAPLSALHAFVAVSAATAMLVLPLAVAVAPAASTAYAQTCPTGFPAPA